MRRNFFIAPGGVVPIYPTGTILAYEFNESSSPAVDAINGYEATLGATMSIGGGVMSTSNTDASTDQAITDDPNIYILNGNPRTFEAFIDIQSGGSIPAILSLMRLSTTAAALYASSISGYTEFILGPISGGLQSVRFNAGVSYSNIPYHLVLVFDGVDAASFNSYTLFINGVKFAGVSGPNISAIANQNSFGWTIGTTNGAIDYDYFRARDYAVSDAEAAQMYADRNITP